MNGVVWPGAAEHRQAGVDPLLTDSQISARSSLLAIPDDQVNVPRQSLANSRDLEVGRFIPAAKRRRFAEELRREWRVCGETGVQAQVVSMAESGNPHLIGDARYYPQPPGLKTIGRQAPAQDSETGGHAPPKSSVACP
jgi:hypothetical protein